MNKIEKYDSSTMQWISLYVYSKSAICENHDTFEFGIV